jgi:antitoxin component of RelBE/YafQ-DinJ toxin-antitoxin module
MPVTDVIRARTDCGAKERAAAAFADMGWSISDAIRLLMVGAGDQLLPLEANTPTANRASAELEGRQAWAFARISDFMADPRNEGD